MVSGESVASATGLVEAVQNRLLPGDGAQLVHIASDGETYGHHHKFGEMALAYVRGLQGPDRKRLATLKHYVGHSYSEGARNHAPVHLGWRELNDDFMLPFEMAVKLGQASSVMPAAALA